MREGVNRSPLELYFDTVDFRLHPVHPFLHLLPAAESQRIEEAGRRFGWKERNSRKLKELPGMESKQEAANRPKSFESMLPLADFDMPSAPVPTKRRNLLQLRVYAPELSAEQRGFALHENPPLYRSRRSKQHPFAKNARRTGGLDVNDTSPGRAAPRVPPTMGS